MCVWGIRPLLHFVPQTLLSANKIKKLPICSQLVEDVLSIFFVRSQFQIPNIGVGKDYDEMQESLISFEQCHAPFSILVVNIRIVVMNNIRCPKYFFSMIVAAVFGFPTLLHE